MTIKDIQMYRFLDHAINLAIRDVNSLAGSNSIRDSVTGSNPDYPYEERNFTVVGNDLFNVVCIPVVYYNLLWGVNYKRNLRSSLD